MEKDFCPNGHDMQGGEIPADLREQGHHGDSTHWSRKIGVEIGIVYDGVLYWSCPDCGVAWPRFTDGFRSEVSRRFADAANARQVSA